MSRIKNTTRNTTFAFVRYLLQIITQFAVRTAFIYTLSSHFLGLDSLFLNIIFVLSIAELGLGVAISYSMYKPAAEGDIEKLKELNALFRKVYCYIGLIVVGLGLIVTPFLHLLINGPVPDGINIYVVFFAFLLTTLISYLAAHKRVLLFVFQRNDIVSKLSALGMLVTRGLQIAILFLTYSYYWFVAIMPLGMLFECLFVFFVARRLYPEIRGKAKRIDDATKKAIIKNVASLGFHRLSNVLVISASTIIISVFFGLEVLGLSANYVLILSSVLMMVDIFISSVQASVGNMIASDTTENNYKMFKMLNLVFYMLVGFCAVAMFCLYQPFISLWVGGAPVQDIWISGSLINSGWLLSVAFMLSIVLRFFFTQITGMVFTYRMCAGLMWNDRWVPIITVPLNVGLSILFIHLFGLPGVFLGTAIAFALIAIWVTPYIIHKHYFKKSVCGHYLQFVVFTFATAIAAGVSYFVCLLLPDGFWFLCIRGLVCCAITGTIYLAVFGWTKEFKSILSYLKGMYKKRTLMSKKQEAS